jgi:hypothetical protein
MRRPDYDRRVVVTGLGVISPVGNGPQYIAAVVATSEPDRQALVQYLQNAGYQPPHGKTLDQFVRLAPTIDTALLG